MEQKTSIWDRVETQPLARAVFLGIIALILLIPIGLIDDLIRERRHTALQATQDITSRWGSNQSVVGPVLQIAWSCRWTSSDKQGKLKNHHYTNTLNLLPKTLEVRGASQNSTRHRGIFEVGIYQAAISLSGSFDRPQVPNCSRGDQVVHWNSAKLLMQLTDTHALRGRPTVQWNEHSSPFVPGGERLLAHGNPAIEASLKGLMQADTQSFSFDIPLELNGSGSILIAPTAEETVVNLESNWPHPSFHGQWLPVEHQINETGFAARWKVPYLGRGYPQQWHGETAAQAEQMALSLFGVQFLVPVDAYAVTERSVKYAVLFIGFTFLSLWLFEILAGLRIHGIQYLLFGAALCLFYLLVLSLAEHIGIAWAYLASSTTMVAVISAYALAVLKSTLRALLVSLLVSLLYGYLYVLLQLESYALLTGSIGLLIGLASVMWLTRGIDWYALSAQMQTREDSTPPPAEEPA